MSLVFWRKQKFNLNHLFKIFSQRKMNILVINAGSSSVKYQLIDIITKQVAASGIVERIGIEGSLVKHKYTLNGKTEKKEISQPLSNHEEALHIVSNLLIDSEIGVISDPNDIKAVGHRVLHGGEKFTKTVLVTEEVKETIRELSPLGPLHMPANLAGIEVCEKVFPMAKQVAVFDTSFHQTMPEKAFRYAIPNKFYTENGIRAYGFHGTSHKFVYNEATKYLNNPNLKAITLHLGNGASMAAVDTNQVKDTTMGMGPLSGLIMGTRSGDIDPSIIFYMAEELGYTFNEVKDILNKESGMLGISECSDARDVQANFEKGDPKAILCNDMYCYRIQKYIGAYVAALNGLDVLIFTGGIGENDDLIRKTVCTNLEYFGIEMDYQANDDKNHASKIEELHTPNSKVKILIIPTNEELQIATETYELVK